MSLNSYLGLFALCQFFFGYFSQPLWTQSEISPESLNFLTSTKPTVQTRNEVVWFFYNLAEYAFEHLRNSRRILAPLAKSFFSQIVFRNMIVPLPRSCSSSCSRRTPTVFLLLFVCLLFFWHNKWYEVFLAPSKSHNLRTETKCRKLSPEGFCVITPQKQSWGRQPPMKDKGKIGLDREELACGETTLWMKSYYLNIYFQLVFIIFELFSVNRRNQVENYTVVWAKIISFVLFEINCISVAGAWFTALYGVFVSLSGQVSDYRRWGL